LAEFKAKFNYEGRLKLEENLPLDSPLVVYVEPSSFCNLECKFCPQHSIAKIYFSKIYKKSYLYLINALNNAQELKSKYFKIYGWYVETKNFL